MKREANFLSDRESATSFFYSTIDDKQEALSVLFQSRSVFPPGFRWSW